MTDSDDAFLEYRRLHQRDDGDWVAVDYAGHRIRPWCIGERCVSCHDAPATHKIGDETGPRGFHNLTAYICCSCMGSIGMPCGLYPPY